MGRLSYREAARIAGVEYQAILRWIKEGRLPRLIDREHLIAMLPVTPRTVDYHPPTPPRQMSPKRPRFDLTDTEEY